MKTYLLFLIPAILIGLMGCRDDYSDENVDVEAYVELLKNNQYDSLYLPFFEYSDIPALLKYRNETMMISHFPRNPISSYYDQECRLGIYVLWTIESIRAVAIKKDKMVLRFPSQNSILELKDANEMKLVSDNRSHETAADAYFDWWNKNRHRDFDRFKNTDPLEKTNYRWH